LSKAIPRPVERLVDEFGRLPGIGPKTAARLTFYLLRMPAERSRELAAALIELVDAVIYCERCFNIAEASPCAICSDENRDTKTICVVEDPLDVVALERTSAYKGVYHVLHGALSPVDGIGPSDLRIGELVNRLAVEDIEEVILATNPSMEGDSTAMYLENYIGGHAPEIRVTRLARGLPIGGDIEYADDMTLTRALDGRS
jgi:recombination protein RecR